MSELETPPARILSAGIMCMCVCVCVCVCNGITIPDKMFHCSMLHYSTALLSRGELLRLTCQPSSGW